jgi:hypothetical protein
MSSRLLRRQMRAASHRIERKMRDASRAADRRREREWRAVFERAGPEIIRMLLFSAVVNRESLPPVLFHISHGSAERTAALEWLRKKDRAAHARAGVLYALIVIAMVASCIAAVPVVIAWLPK